MKAEIRKEFLHIVAWLQATGAANFQSIAQDFIDGKQIAIPELKLFWQQVKYSSTVFVADQPLYTTPKTKHAAFVLVWDKTGTANITYDTTDDRVAAADNALRPKWSIGIRYALGSTGSRVVFVTPNGPADKAGLKVNDVLLKADGRSVGVSDNTTDLLAQSLLHAVDGNLTLDVLTPPASNSVIQVKLVPAS